MTRAAPIRLVEFWSDNQTAAPVIHHLLWIELRRVEIVVIRAVDRMRMGSDRGRRHGIVIGRRRRAIDLRQSVA